MKYREVGRQERAVLKAIEADPSISQAKIARALRLARSTVAAHVVALASKGHILGRGYVLPKSRRIVCLGGATVDRKYRAIHPIVSATSNPVSGRRTFGGVARNVCENLARLRVETALVSLVGDDEAGRALVDWLRGLGADTSGVLSRHDAATAEYVALVGPDSSLVVGAADMGIFDSFTLPILENQWPRLAAASWVFADCNVTKELLRALIARRRTARFKLAIDGVSTPKAQRLPADLRGVDLLFLNRDEARAYLRKRALSPAQAARALRARGAESVVLTLGNRGALVATARGVMPLPPVAAQPVDVTGAGDALIAGVLSSLHAGKDLAEATRIGCLLAALTIESEASVRQDLSPEFVARSAKRMSRRRGGRRGP